MKKEKLEFEIAEYLYSQGDHNTRGVVKIIMAIIDEFKWWIYEWHTMTTPETPKYKKEEK